MLQHENQANRWSICLKAFIELTTSVHNFIIGNDVRAQPHRVVLIDRRYVNFIGRMSLTLEFVFLMSGLVTSVRKTKKSSPLTDTLSEQTKLSGEDNL